MNFNYKSRTSIGKELLKSDKLLVFIEINIKLN